MLIEVRPTTCNFRAAVGMLRQLVRGRLLVPGPATAALAVPSLLAEIAGDSNAKQNVREMRVQSVTKTVDNVGDE
jgi:hypothetical protein